MIMMMWPLRLPVMMTEDSNEGLVMVFLGTATGLESTPVWSVTGS